MYQILYQQCKIKITVLVLPKVNVMNDGITSTSCAFIPVFCYYDRQNGGEIKTPILINDQASNTLKAIVLSVDPSIFTEDELKDQLRRRIKQNTTPRHVPEVIVSVAALPRTLSGKIVELAVRAVVHNLPVKNQEALANPEALEYFRNIPELQK